MTDFATLGVEFVSRGGNHLLNELEKVQTGSARTERQVTSLMKATSALRRLIALGAVGMGINAYLDLADKMQSLNSQLKFVTNSQAQFNHAQTELFNIAQNTRASLESTTQLYIKSSQALKDYGYAQKDILKFTETINKAMAVGGVDAQSQASALLQLSQALGSGQLQGDEFKTIAESAPIILDVLAEYMGKSRAEVKKLASDGKLTADLLFNAFNGSSEKINEKFKEMPLTFGSAMQQMQNAVLQFIGSFDSASGISGTLAQGVSFLAENFNILAKAVGYATASYMAYNLVSFAANFKQASGGVGILSASFGRLATMVRTATAAMLANPLLLLVSAIGTAAFTFDAFISDMVVGASQVEATWGDVANGVWADFKDLVGQTADWITNKWQEATSDIGVNWADLGNVFANVGVYIVDLVKLNINTIIGVFVAGYNVVTTAWEDLPSAFSAIGKMAINGLISIIESGLNHLVNAVKTFLGFFNFAANMVGLDDLFDTSGWKIELPKLKLDQAETQIKDKLGNAVQQAFSTDYVGDAVDSTMKYLVEAGDRYKQSQKQADTNEAIKKSIPSITEDKKGKNKKGKNDKSEDYLKQWKQHYNELERANADSWTRIALEEQRSMQEMLEKAKQAKAAQSEIEHAKTLILARYTKERQKIAEQYAPELKFERELQEQIQEINRLQQAQMLTTEQAGTALQMLGSKYDPILTAQQQYIQNLKEIELLQQKGSLTDEQAGIAKDKAKWEAGNQIAKSAGENAVSGYDRWKAQFDPMQAIQNEQASKLAELQSYYDQGLIQYQDFVNAKAQIDAQATADTQNLFMSSISGFGSALDTMMGVMKTAGKEQSGIYRAMFAMSKAFAIADSMLKLQQAIMQATADPSALTPAQKFANMAAVATAGANVISQITSVAMSGMAHSGIDNIPKEGTWLLDKGERVVDSRTNQDLKTFLANANKGGQSGGKSTVNVKIINNGQAVDAKVSQEQRGDETHITVELMKTMKQIAKQEASKAITDNFGRAGGTFYR